MAELKQSTVRVRVFKMIDSADHFTRKTGLTCTVNISKNGGAFGAAAGAVAEIANGWYSVSLTTVDTGTLGDLAYYITAAGADDTDFSDQVTLYILGDTMKVDVDTIKTNPVVNGGTITFPTNATVASTTNITAGTITTVTTATTATNVTTVNGLAANVITAASIAADAITAAKIADGAIDAATFAASAITATVLAADCITAAKIADGAIDAATFAASAITATVLAADCITAAKIAPDAIGASELAADAVTEIQSGLATAAALVTVQADTDDIQARLPAALTANGNIKADTLRVGGTLQTAGDLATLIIAVDDFVDTEVAAILAAVDTEVAAIKAVTDLLPNGGALTSLATQASVNVIDDFLDTEIAAIKAKTDQLTFTKANELDSNIQSVNDTTVNGNGGVGTEWGP